ncbi:MAG: SdrD B-like domain-containing protein [Caldilineaceae bacterium]
MLSLWATNAIAPVQAAAPDGDALAAVPNRPQRNLNRATARLQTAGDLALRVEAVNTGPVALHKRDQVDLTVTVFNQGATPVTNIELAAYPAAHLYWVDNYMEDANGVITTPGLTTWLITETVQPNSSWSTTIAVGAAATLPAGLYTATMEISSATDLAGAAIVDADSTLDSQNNETNVKDDEIAESALTGGDEDDHDIVVLQQNAILDGSVGNFAWNDLNRDGLQTNGEPGLNGVTVRLLDGAGQVVEERQTANNTQGSPGYYTFGSLEVGESYVVEFVAPAGYRFTMPDQNGGVPCTGVCPEFPADSDADMHSGRTSAIMLGDGSSADCINCINVDAGLVALPPLPNNGDGNGDGVADVDQPYVVNVLDLTGDSYITTELEGACTTLTDLAVVPEIENGASRPNDANYDYPLGLVDVRLTCPQPGDAATVSYYFHGAEAQGGWVFRKYGPQTPGDANTSSWYDYPAQFSTVVLNEQGPALTALRATMIITDGQPGDDTAADGLLVDPSGIAGNGDVALSKTLNTPLPLQPNQSISFTIRVENVSAATLTSVELTEVFDPSYLSFFSSVNTVPLPDVVNSGELIWPDLTNTFGDLAPGQSIEIVVYLPRLKRPAMPPTVSCARAAICVIASVGDAVVGFTLPVEPNLSAKSTLGDWVWYDTNANGVKDVGELGINGVLVELYELTFVNGVTTTTFIESMVTGPDGANVDSDDVQPTEAGAYDFRVQDNKIYQVVIAPSNFAPGGVLEHYVYTGENASNAYNGPQPRVVNIGTQVDYNDADFPFWLPSLLLEKTASAIADNLNGTYSVRHRITVTNTGTAATTYALVDQFGFAPDVTVVDLSVSNNAGVTVNSTFDGQSNSTLVSNASIAANTTHMYEVDITVSYTGPSDPVVALSTCDSSSPQPGTGFYNQAALTVEGGATYQATACPPIAPLVGRLQVDKQSVSVTDLGSSRYQVRYRIQVENVGSVNKFYSLSDTPDFGANITIESATLSVNNGPLQSLSLSDGAAQTLAANRLLPVAATDSYLLTVIVDASSAPVPSATVNSCTPANPTPNTGLYNKASLMVNGQLQESAVCPPLGASQLLIQKQSLTPIENGNGTFIVNYAITVQNTGTAIESYTVSDTFDFSGDFAAVGAVNVIAPVGVNPNPGFDGQANPVLASSVSLAGGGLHVYLVTVNVMYTGSGSAIDAIATCDPANPQPDLGLFNQAELNASGTAQQDDACPAAPQTGALIVSKWAEAMGVGGGLYEVTYHVTVSNTGSSQATYMLNDAFAFDADFSIASGPTVSGPAGVTVNPSFNGVTNTNLATNALLAAGASHIYTIQLNAAYTGSGSAGAAIGQCDPLNPAPAMGLFNAAVLTAPSGVPIEAEACPRLAALEVQKVFNGAPPAMVGERISFTIRMTNTGSVTITSLPLEDQYNQVFFTYEGASMTPDIVAGAGALSWSNVVPVGGLMPGGVVEIDVFFTAMADTTLLSPTPPCTAFREAPNVARVENAAADPDGNGSMPALAISMQEDCASVAIQQPTAINLINTSATQTADGVLLQWTTITEQDITGFRVLRSNGVTVHQVSPADIGAASTPHDELIPAKNAGQSNGAAYSVLDVGATLIHGDVYVLETIHNDGSVERNVLSISTEGAIYLPLVVR